MKVFSFFFLLAVALLATPSAGVLTDCVVQAFGTGLGGKGIAVEVVDNGFNCQGSPWPWKKVEGLAKFDSTGEAEVKLRLHAGVFGICMLSMNIRVELPYTCQVLTRTVTRASWAGTFGGQGSCRALQQKCDRSTTNAAIPYFDMWCRTPTGIGSVFGGKAQELRLDWAFPTASDKC